MYQLMLGQPIGLETIHFINMEIYYHHIISSSSCDHHIIVITSSSHHHHMEGEGFGGSMCGNEVATRQPERIIQISHQYCALWLESFQFSDFDNKVIPILWQVESFQFSDFDNKVMIPTETSS